MRRASLVMLACAASACTALLPGDDVIHDSDTPPIGARDGGSDAGQAPEQEEAGVDAGADAGAACPPAGEREVVVLSQQQLSEDARWTCAADYEIDGYVAVTAGTLTIDPGVTVRARAGAFVLIGKGARLSAVGRADAPIVFTAAERPAAPGAWAGVYLLGAADTALPNSATLGFPSGDVRGFYGGSNHDHDCGELRYARIEFAGGATDEYDFPGAALMLAGCGRRTRVSHLQVHAATDGIGLVGGSAPLSRVLVTAPRADGIEWSAGYTGFIQFAIVQTFYGSGAALKGSRLEADQVTPPASEPILFNVTLVGASGQGLPRGAADPSGFENGVQLQAGTRATLRNALVYGFPGAWVDVIGSEAARLVGTSTQLTNSIFADPAARAQPGFPADGVEPGDGEDDDGGLSEDQQFRAPSCLNRFPSSGLALPVSFAAPPARPAFSADGFVDGGNLADAAPAGWEDVWEPAFYAGALPKIQLEADGALDWTCGAEPGADCTWTAFPQE
jgi:hypothetical protein